MCGQHHLGRLQCVGLCRFRAGSLIASRRPANGFDQPVDLPEIVLSEVALCAM